MMATIEERLQNVRTLEDIVNLLTILFTNLNNQNKIYYDMFLNPTPMDLTLERYNDNGVLEEIVLPNRAKDRIWVLTGDGNPNGKVGAEAGTLYLDLNEDSGRNLYYKSTGGADETSGWQLIYSPNNLDYLDLFPSGNASVLKNLDASNIDRGTLKVNFGGTGATRITQGSLVQGNGQDPFSAYNISDITSLLDDFTGMIMYSPVEEITGRWLICDGTEYNINERPELTKLLNKIGNKYGGNGVTTFKVPKLTDKYIKGGDTSSVGQEVSGNVMAHRHNLSGSVNAESNHTHGGGSLTVPNTYAQFAIRRTGSAGGAFSFVNWGSYRGDADGDGNNESRKLVFDSANKWSGTTEKGSSHTHSLNGVRTESTGQDTNEVNHMKLVPVIRY